MTDGMPITPLPNQDSELDIVQSMDLVGDVERDLTVQLIEQILARSHPMVADGLFLSSVPPSYDLDLIGALRTVEDGKDAKLIDRLSKFSFVTKQFQADVYSLEKVHRHILQEEFIERDKMGYVAAHRRALLYFRENPVEDEVVQAQNLLYHGILAESLTSEFNDAETIDHLVGHFRAYVDERQLAAIERLLNSARAARVYLKQMETPWLGSFDDLITHLTARYDQMLGRWSQSRSALEALNQKADLLPRLVPYVSRAFGDSLAYSGDFVGAISQYKASLSHFDDQIKAQGAAGLEEQELNTTRAELGATMIALGDAHAGLAIATRGQQETLRDHGLITQIRDWLATFLSMPMILYLWFYLGWRVWHPRFWTALRGEDWLIARLFALSGYWYKKADPILETYGTRPEAVAADERLAFLYLEMGDVFQASTIFERLLEEHEAPLGEYRRASVELGLAEAFLEQNQPGRAYVLLNKALPILERFQDFSLSARAEALLGDVLVAMGDPDTGVTHLAGASQRYQTLGNWVSATEIAGRLERIIDKEAVVPLTVQTARPYIEQLEERHYPVQYVHPFLKWLKSTLVLSFAAALLFVPVMVLRYEVNSGLAPAINFRPVPLLEVDGPLTTSLNQTVQDVAAAQDSLLTSAESLLNIGYWVIGGYILLTLLAGLIVIVFTPLSTVQEQGSANLVKLTRDGISLGGGGSRQFRWSELRRVVLADMRFWPDKPMLGASMSVGDGTDYVRIWGATRQFDDLRARILKQVEGRDEVEIVNRDSLATANLWVWIYSFGVLLMWGLILVTRWAPQSVWRDWIGIYSTADLYPYLYLFMFVPICWWVVGRQAWQIVETDPYSRWPWLIIVSGVLTGGWQISTRFLNLFTVPDIYPPLFTLVLLTAATWFLWRAKTDAGPIYSAGIKFAALLLLAGLGSIMVTRIARDVMAYHYLNVGRYFNEQAIERRDGGQAFGNVFEGALLNYDRAAELAGSPILGINNARSLRIRLGVPLPEDHLVVQALRDRAILNAQVGNFDQAIEDMTNLLPQTNNQAQIHAWMAIAHQSNASGDLTAVNAANYELALEEYTKAIELNPEHAEYYLWRGIARHGLERPRSAEFDYRQSVQRSRRAADAEDRLTPRQRAQAFTGAGWIRWTESDYDAALELFQMATQADQSYSDALLGLGYTYYRLNLFTLAEDAFTEANALAPDDPLPLIGLGTVNWKLGSIAANPRTNVGREVCGLEGAPPQVKLEAQTRWEKSIEAFEASTELGIQNDVDVAYTYRTMGQVEYLLRDCPAYVENKNDQYAAAIDRYASAIELNPNEDRYWELSGRLKYALWLRTRGAGLLLGAQADLEQALALNPSNGGAQRFLNAVNGSIRQESGEGAIEPAADERIGEDAASQDREAADRACTYQSQFVRDVTVPDDTVYAAGQSFEKIWRIRNVSSCDWEDDVRWAFAADNQMEAVDSVLIQPTARGQEVEVGITFVAPSEPGTYVSRWAIQPPGQDPISNTYYVRIVVEE